MNGEKKEEKKKEEIFISSNMRYYCEITDPRNARRLCQPLSNAGLPKRAILFCAIKVSGKRKLIRWV